MLFRLLVGLLVINIPTLHATDSNKPDDADTQAVATQGQPLGNATGEDSLCAQIDWSWGRTTNAQGTHAPRVNKRPGVQEP
jgi:hypothetical protein